MLFYLLWYYFEEDEDVDEVGVREMVRGWDIGGVRGFGDTVALGTSIRCFSIFKTAKAINELYAERDRATP